MNMASHQTQSKRAVPVGNLEGVLLQSKLDSGGRSKNPAFVRSAGGRE